MYTLYIANRNYSSWSLRSWLLMRHLEIPFTDRVVNFNDGPFGASWEKFRAFSPTGKLPCLVDGKNTVWETLSIAEYLAERHSGIWPEDATARAWARCVSAEMHAGFAALRKTCPMNYGVRVELGNTGMDFDRDVARIDEIWKQGLAYFGGPFLVGQSFTAADAFFAPIASRFQTYGIRSSSATAAYASHLLELPSMKEWESSSLQEVWREARHEQEMRAAGTLLRDLRS